MCALCGALLLLAASAPRAALFDDDEARKQIAAERARINDLQKQIDARLGRIEEAVKGQGLLDLQSQVQQLRDDMAKLRGQLEVVNNNIENTAKRQRDMYIDLDTRLRRFETPGAVAPPPAAAPPVSAAPPSPPPVAVAPAVAAAAASTAPSATPPPPVAAPAQVTLDPNESRAYESAQGQRRIGNYQGAIFAFQNFLKQYPKSTLAPRAQYWIGDSYFNLRDYKSAMTAQQSLLKTWPDSPSVPDAMLNIASAQSELGDMASAKRTMEDIVGKYPASDAAEKAKRRLATPPR
jgi:tol-pal system protein YbgF